MFNTYRCIFGSKAGTQDKKTIKAWKETIEVRQTDIFSALILIQAQLLQRFSLHESPPCINNDFQIFSIKRID